MNASWRDVCYQLVMWRHVHQSQVHNSVCTSLMSLLQRLAAHFSSFTSTWCFCGSHTIYNMPGFILGAVYDSMRIHFSPTPTPTHPHQIQHLVIHEKCYSWVKFELGNFKLSINFDTFVWYYQTKVSNKHPKEKVSFVHVSSPMCFRLFQMWLLIPTSC